MHENYHFSWNTLYMRRWSGCIPLRKWMQICHSQLPEESTSSSESSRFQTIGNHHWLKIVRETNVKTLNAGWQKRDPSKESVRSTDSHRIAFLLEFAQWLIDWQAMGQSATSLTQETFQCAIQTAQTLPKFAVYLIKKRGYKFVLLWNSNSQISSKGPSDVTDS